MQKQMRQKGHANKKYKEGNSSAYTERAAFTPGKFFTLVNYAIRDFSIKMLTCLALKNGPPIGEMHAQCRN